MSVHGRHIRSHVLGSGGLVLGCWCLLSILFPSSWELGSLHVSSLVLVNSVSVARKTTGRPVLWPPERMTMRVMPVLSNTGSRFSTQIRRTTTAPRPIANASLLRLRPSHWRPSAIVLRDSSENEDGSTSSSTNAPSAAEEQATIGKNKRSEDLAMEQLSQLGADRIASLRVPERSQRALLAEMVEDRIFDLTDQLDKKFQSLEQPAEDKRMEEMSTTARSSSSSSTIQKLASELRSLRSQYRDLVTGMPSPLLRTIEGGIEDAAGTNGMDDNDESASGVFE